MPDREKVINAVEEAFDMYKSEYEGTSFFDGKEWAENKRDAIELLKVQEPVEPELEGGGSSWWYVCCECHTAIETRDKFCRECGRRILWGK